MTFETTDHVPGLGEAELENLIDEAEAGYDLDAALVEPNPHRLVVPDDLRDAITSRAKKDGESPDDVVRQALAAYLDTA